RVGAAVYRDDGGGRAQGAPEIGRKRAAAIGDVALRVEEASRAIAGGRSRTDLPETVSGLVAHVCRRCDRSDRRTQQHEMGDTILEPGGDGPGEETSPAMADQGDGPDDAMIAALEFPLDLPGETLRAASIKSEGGGNGAVP